MVVFEYFSPSVVGCHALLLGMELPGEPIQEETLDGYIVWKGDKFVASFNEEEHCMELYGTYPTNSIKYYERRYPRLEYDKVQVISTKRW